MKKLISVIFTTTILSGLSAQGNDDAAKHYLKVYKQALIYNDASTAINALQNYIAIDNNIQYKDTLSMLYFTAKSYYSALLIAEEVFKAAPDNIISLARAAECYAELGDPKTATELYEKVILKTKSPYHMYKMALCQYQLKRLAECEATAKFAMASEESKKIGVQFALVDGSQQNVPVIAAAANLLGVMKMDSKNFAGAKADFEQALKLFPDFAGAKANLDVCEKNMKGKSPVKN